MAQITPQAHLPGWMGHDVYATMIPVVVTTFIIAAELWRRRIVNP